MLTSYLPDIITAVGNYCVCNYTAGFITVPTRWQRVWKSLLLCYRSRHLNEALRKLLNNTRRGGGFSLKGKRKVFLHFLKAKSFIVGFKPSKFPCITTCSIRVNLLMWSKTHRPITLFKFNVHVDFLIQARFINSAFSLKIDFSDLGELILWSVKWMKLPGVTGAYAIFIPTFLLSCFLLFWCWAARTVSFLSLSDLSAMKLGLYACLLV